MEITPQLLYWLTRLDPLTTLVLVALTVAIAATALYAVIGITDMAEGDSDEQKAGAVLLSKSLKRGGIVIALIALVFGLIPTTKEMAAILVIPAVANSEAVGEIGGEIVGLAGDWLKELRPESVLDETPLEVQPQTSEE